ncbi:metallophosphoesterase [Nonomuraea sp. B10E15]|uniref:metallophosphoesterase family protein n=1 Tax=Nonomuraea sp. B10E15 TaxID=3153560 RepID=UPI00325D601A
MAAARLAVIADSHLCSPGTPYGHWNDRLLLPESWTLWREAVDFVAASAAEAVMLLGDVTNFAEPDLLVRGLRELARAGRPVIAVAGNHDVEPVRDALAAAKQAIPALTVPGLTPSPSPAFGGLHVAGVPIRASRQGGHVLDGDELHDLPGDRPLVMISHYPILDIEADLTRQHLRHPDHLGGVGPLRRQLHRHRGPGVVLHGHVHRHHAARSGRLLQLSMAPLIESPHAVTLLTLRTEPDGLNVDRETVPLRAASRPTPALEHWMFQDGRWTLDPTPSARRPQP